MGIPTDLYLFLMGILSDFYLDGIPIDLYFDGIPTDLYFASYTY